MMSGNPEFRRKTCVTGKSLFAKFHSYASYTMKLHSLNLILVNCMPSSAVNRASASASDASEEAPASPLSMRSPSPGSAEWNACARCGTQFSITRHRHSCRACSSIVCSSCSSSRLRLVVGGEKERVCDACSREWRASHADELEESVDVRTQMNESLKQLLREKYENIEAVKKSLVELIDRHQYLQDAPTLNAPFRFSPAMGLDRINFAELIKFLDARLLFLRNRTQELDETIERERSEHMERRRNFGFLVQRTEKAEVDASRVSELVEQRDRLRDIFREQAARLRSLKDRVDILENRDIQSLSGNQDQVPASLDAVMADEFIGDRLVNNLCPCAKCI